MPVQKQHPPSSPSSRTGQPPQTTSHPGLKTSRSFPITNQHLRPPPYSTTQSYRTSPMATYSPNPRQATHQVDQANMMEKRSSSAFSHENPFADTYHLERMRRGNTTTRFVLGPDPDKWGYDVSPKAVDSDDWLHDKEKNVDDTGSIWTWRGITTLGTIIVLFGAVFYLFLGYSIQTGIKAALKWGKSDGYNIGGINATGQVMEGVFSLIDHETPMDVRTKTSPEDGRTMQLVFSDEFNKEGRTFWPGDDPYWEAVDLHYWPTGDLEWYDPQQVYTKDGQLWLELKPADNKTNHDMDYVGGMISSWNKLCFTGGYIEASVQLPGSPDVNGFWPAIWTMGNLGRAGYGATTEGLWPYSYEACDIGTVPNQTENGFPPAQELQMGDQYADYYMSFLPGQRLSSCTCPGEPHPGPVHRDGSFVPRGAPEIDMFEAQVDKPLKAGAVSQSVQIAPFNGYYQWDNKTYATYYMDEEAQRLNNYGGGAYQQAGSVVSRTNQACYQLPGPGVTPCYSTYGFQYKPGFAEDGGHITWINDDRLAWKLDIAGWGSDPNTGISPRSVSKEPMYVIMNLGISLGFSLEIDFTALTFPAYMKVDWIRIYQYEDEINVSCDPPSHPTSNYIDRYIEAYTNPNLTTWSRAAEDGGYEQPWPRNSRVTSCDN
ncbi:hypothetical protein FRB91_008253 [Serendipita sp. 411]|nr:hypothetical protein FRB91_008253 [Serendipita sp. 411]